MAMSVTYINFAGELVLENRGGTVSGYVPDTLGSTAQLWSSAGVKTDEWTYWPFGRVRTRTGTTATPLTFCGTLGYHMDILDSLTYVRARSLRQALARWQTQDLLWPAEPPYCYAENAPSSTTDPSGLCNAIHTTECILLCTCLSVFAAGYICRFPSGGTCYVIGNTLYCKCLCTGYTNILS